MTLYELRSLLRADYLDDVIDAADNDAPAWTDATLNRYIALAQREACKRARLLYDDSTEAVCQISLQEGTASYPLHDSVLDVEDAVIDGQSLIRVHRDDVGDAWRTDIGTPTHWWVRGQTISLYPRPAADLDDETLSLEVYRLPLAGMECDEDEPEIPEEHHQDLLYYAAYLALNRRDPDTQNTGGASENLAMFERIFGAIRDAEAREQRREHEVHLVVRPC